SNIFHRGFRQDPVAQIKDVSCSSASVVQNSPRACLDLFPIREQQNRIEIALHCAVVPQQLPSFIERNAPVQSDNISSSFLHLSQQRGRIGSKINNRRARSFQSSNQLRRPRQ